MTLSTRLAQPVRSVLYIPGSKPRALDKARSLAVDAIIFDLEDAVSVEEKENARATLAEALAAGGYGARLKIVRINGLDTQWGRADAEAVASMDCDAVLLPKVSSPEDLDALAALTGVSGEPSGEHKGRSGETAPGGSAGAAPSAGGRSTARRHT